MENKTLEEKLGSLIIATDFYSYDEVCSAYEAPESEVYNKKYEKLEKQREYRTFCWPGWKEIQAIIIPRENYKVIIAGQGKDLDLDKTIVTFADTPRYALCHGLGDIVKTGLSVEDFKKKYSIDHLAEFHHAEEYKDILDAIKKVITVGDVESYKNLIDLIKDEEEKTKEWNETLKNFSAEYTTDFIKLGEALKQIKSRNANIQNVYKRYSENDAYFAGFIALGYGDIEKAKYYAEQTKSEFNKDLLLKEIAKREK